MTTSSSLCGSRCGKAGTAFSAPCRNSLACPVWFVSLETRLLRKARWIAPPAALEIPSRRGTLTDLLSIQSSRQPLPRGSVVARLYTLTRLRAIVAWTRVNGTVIARARHYASPEAICRSRLARSYRCRAKYLNSLGGYSIVPCPWRTERVKFLQLLKCHSLGRNVQPAHQRLQREHSEHPNVRAGHALGIQSATAS